MDLALIGGMPLILGAIGIMRFGVRRTWLGLFSLAAILIGANWMTAGSTHNDTVHLVTTILLTAYTVVVVLLGGILALRDYWKRQPREYFWRQVDTWMVLLLTCMVSSILGWLA